MWFYDGLREIIDDRFLILDRSNHVGFMRHSLSNSLGIKLRARRSFTYSGFKMRYLAVRELVTSQGYAFAYCTNLNYKGSCGEDDLKAVDLTKNITSPGFPTQHFSNQICAWDIVSPTNHVIELQAGYVSNETCCDFVKIHQTTSDIVHLTSNQSHTSPGAKVTVEFISINSSQRSGFSLQFRAVHVCGVREFDVETNLEQVVNTPGYPKSYANTLDCWYTFTSPKDTRIRFWVDKFGTQTFSSSYFQFYVYNGWNEDGKKFLTLNHISQVGIMQHSISNVMSIKLKVSRSRTNYMGFTMRYTAVSSCGAVLEASDNFQLITPPGYPSAYPSNLICNWTIRAPCEHVVELTVLNFDESYDDTLMVIESTSLSKRLEGKEVYMSLSNIIEMDFITNGSTGNNGFQVRFTAVHICGKTDLLADIGQENEIKQIGYPGGYRSNALECWYTIRSAERTRIRFKYPEIDGKILRNDRFRLNFYDGLDDQSPLLLTLTGINNNADPLYHSNDNLLGVKLTLDRRNIVYNGLILKFSAFESEKGLSIRVRVDLDKTFRIKPSEELIKRYLLSEYEALDVSNGIFQQIQEEYEVNPQLIAGEEPSTPNGTVASIRVDLRWSFIVYMQPENIGKYYFVRNAQNDVTLSVFSKIREESDVVQLVDITQFEPQNATFFLTRVDFHRWYKVSVPSFAQTQYRLTLDSTNDLSLAVFLKLRKVAYLVQLTALEMIDASVGVSIAVRVDFWQDYDVIIANAIRIRYGFHINSTNEVKSSVFTLIRREAQSVQLVKVGDKDEPPSSISLRVDYTRSYQVTLQSHLIAYYDFDASITNDVAVEIFNELRPDATYVQLTSYNPSAPSILPVSIRSDYTRTYHAALPNHIKERYYLVSNSINDVSEDIFVIIRREANFIQQMKVERPKTPQGILTRIRVNFNEIYTAYVSTDVMIKYALSNNQTNDMRLDFFSKLRSDINTIQLVEIVATTPIGTRITVRENLNRVHYLYLLDDVIKHYCLQISRINDVTSTIFTSLRDVANNHQIIGLDSISPTGVKISVRVDYQRVYDVYVAQEVRRIYGFIIGRENEMSSDTFLSLQKDAIVAQLIRIQVSDSTPFGFAVRVRVEDDRVYSIYVTIDVTLEYSLDLNVTNDVSTEIFARLQGKASSFQLIGIGGGVPLEGTELTVRVDSNQIYRITFDGEAKSKYPLVAGLINDVTSELFSQIREDAIRVQLLKVDVPVTVSVRVDSTWVYRLVVTDRLRERYNLRVEVINDVNTEIFTSLTEETSSVVLIKEAPIVPRSGAVVKIRVNSSWLYDAILSQLVVQKYNLSVNSTNDVTLTIFEHLYDVAEEMQLIRVDILENYNDCPSSNWTRWYNRDDPSGPCDCETLTELREEYPGEICDDPISFEARLENCMTPYDPTLSNIVASSELGFKCVNEDGITCLDYEVRFCCP